MPLTVREGGDPVLSQLAAICRSIWVPASAGMSGRVGPGPAPETEADPIRLEIFNNLFMSVAEQMGVALQNTALFGEHQGAAGFLLRPVRSGRRPDRQRAAHAGAPRLHGRQRAGGADRQTPKPGDVIALNNPYNGGTHLPDVTVVMPVFDDGGERILAFTVAARGHHADIGGTTPGSMPSGQHHCWTRKAC